MKQEKILEKTLYICDNCGEVNVKDTKVENRIETYAVVGKDTTINAQVRVCLKCNEPVYDEILDSQNIEIAYGVYRRNNNVITPQEIRAILDKYSLSKRGLGTLLGWGEVTVHLYETGRIPDEVHNQVLLLIQDPINMAKLFNKFGTRLHNSARNKLSSRLETLVKQELVQRILDVSTEIDGENKADIYSGYRLFNPEILKEMILYFASQKGGVLKTYLSKLLWYSDFLHFRYTTVSLSGAKYIYKAYGATPQHYDIYLSQLIAQDLLSVQEVAIDNTHLSENVTAKEHPDKKLFSPDSISLMYSIWVYFTSATNNKQILQLLNKEAKQLKIQDDSFISYNYADTLLLAQTINKTTLGEFAAR